ncbi:MAG: lamin tail domain-containing protein [Planctomycetota bacterium]|jgi:hypothetical protein
MIFASLVVASMLAGAQDGGDADTHPILTEVLFNLPPRVVGGDVNLDSIRHVTGDEFVEIYNPHDVSINMRGYKLTDSDRQFQPYLEFEFPEFVLGPHETVVVFNGYQSDEIPGHDGTSERAPGEKNPHFNDAWIFRIDPIHGWQAFQNEEDFVVLWSPDGEPLEAVVWGENKRDKLPRTLRDGQIFETGWEIEESFQRVGDTAQWLPHTQIDGKHYSAGRVPTRVMPTAQNRD